MPEKEKNKVRKKKKCTKDKEIPNIKLYNLRGEEIGFLRPGGKVDFNTLLNRDKYKRTYTKKGY